MYCNDLDDALKPGRWFAYIIYVSDQETWTHLAPECEIHDSREQATAWLDKRQETLACIGSGLFAMAEVKNPEMVKQALVHAAEVEYEHLRKRMSESLEKQRCKIERLRCIEHKPVTEVAGFPPAPPGDTVDMPTGALEQPDWWSLENPPSHEEWMRALLINLSCIIGADDLLVTYIDEEGETQQVTNIQTGPLRECDQEQYRFEWTSKDNSFCRLTLYLLWVNSWWETVCDTGYNQESVLHYLERAEHDTFNYFKDMDDDIPF